MVHIHLDSLNLIISRIIITKTNHQHQPIRMERIISFELKVRRKLPKNIVTTKNIKLINKIKIKVVLIKILDRVNAVVPIKK